MNKSLLMQKTIRENNEDLHNFMRDMNHWENEMKRKDAELTSHNESKEFLPPVRSKPKKEKKQPSNKNLSGACESKRISSFDYSSWEKFDVEKACDEIDKPVNIKSESDSESDNAFDRLRQQALYEKGLGNNCVKKEKWEEAIKHYTKAIECYDKDAVFYANRALCYLKTNQLKAAEEDCTKSLNLDSQYVKAYQRRAAARIALEKINEAETDLNSVLKLEPNNTQAKRELEKLKLNKKVPEDTKIEKIPSKKSSLPSMPVSTNKKSENVAGCLKSTCEKEPISYPWEPVDPARIIKSVQKPPHLHSKRPLKRIEIVDVDDLSVDKKISISSEVKSIPGFKEVVDDSEKQISSAGCTLLNKSLESSNGKTSSKANDNMMKNTIISSVSPTEPINLEIPPPARTSVQFCLALKKFNDYPDLLFQYLKKFDGQNFPSIFKDSMESDIFSKIITILTSQFIEHKSPVSSYLYGLASIRRFEMLVLFMSKQDKEGIKKLLNYCVENNEVSCNDAVSLKKKFRLTD